MGKVLRCYRDFSGGLSEVANDNMADHQLAEARNVIPGAGFGIARTYGLTCHEDFPPIPGVTQDSRIYMMTYIRFSDSLAKHIAILRKEEGNDEVWSLWQGEWAKLWEGMAVNGWFTYGNKLYWIDLLGVYTYDGETVSDGEPTPAGETITPEEEAVWEKLYKTTSVVQRGQRFFYATLDNELIFSRIGEPLGIDPTNIINLADQRDDSIYALKEFNGGLLIFKGYGIYYLSGWDFAEGSDIVLTQLTTACGCKWPDSIQFINNGLVFFNDNYLYKLKMNSGGNGFLVENLSEGRMNQAFAKTTELRAVRSLVWDDTYFFSLCSVDTTEEYRYYPSSDAFFGPYTHGARGYFYAADKPFVGLDYGRIAYFDKESLHYIDPANGGFLPIPIRAVTKSFDINNAFCQEVRLKKVMVSMEQYQAEGSHVTVQIRGDYWMTQWDVLADESLVWGESPYGEALWGWRNTVCKEIAVRRKTNYVQFCISDETPEEALLIYGVALLYTQRQPKGKRLGVIEAPVEYD